MARLGVPLLEIIKLRQALPILQANACATVGALAHLLPDVFRLHHFVWKGETKPVAGLQRHPLIDPIFQPKLAWAVSAPLAGRNLHLVTLIAQGSVASSPQIQFFMQYRRNVNKYGRACQGYERRLIRQSLGEHTLC